MKIFLPVCFFLTLFHFSVSAQTNQCGTDEMHQQLYFGFPGIKEKVKQNYQELEAFTQQYVKNHKNAKQGTISFVIPVVFHVIHNYGVENISNDQILDAMRIINEDYQKRNADTANIIPAFQPIAADCEIEFRLAKLDPNGECTNGITRHQDTRTYIGDHSVKSIVQWPPNQYLNIYVCAEAAGLAGHALVPSAADTIPQWDGIVMAHNSVGSIGTSNLTRSVVLPHEIGHYLNLQHTWGGNNVPDYPYLPVADPGNCSYDDGVSDTPNTIGWQSCNTGGQSCGDLDNIQNFMEYAYCPAMFTEGQKLRMHAALNSSIANRNNLWTANNLALTGVDGTNYFCKVDFTQDKDKICVGEQIQFTDLSYHSIDSWQWEFEGGTPAMSNDTNPLVQYDFPGTYQVKLICTSGATTDSLIKIATVEVFNNTSLAPNLLESFEGLNNLDNGTWYTVNPDGGQGWELTSTTGYNSSKCAKMNNYNNLEKSIDYLVSKPIDISGVSDLVLTFDYAYSKRTNADVERILVSVSNDCGATWTVRKTLTSTTFITSSDTVPTAFTPSASEWKSATISTITSAYWTDQFQLRFEFISDNGNNAYIDNIMLFDPAYSSIVDNKKSELNIYPTPTNGKINVTSNVDVVFPKFVLVDALGKVYLINGIQKDGRNFHLDLHEFSAGLYFIRLLDENKVVSSGKIVVQ